LELLEKVNTIFEKRLEQFCDEKKTPENPGWTVVIDDIKGGKGDPKVLADNMVSIGKKKPDKPDPGSPPWDLESCTPKKFPWQAHHLVPEKQLPEHKVCVWLTDSPKTKNKKYELSSDTNYDTNHGRNGRFMPFASTTKQWEAAGDNSTKKSEVCVRMMQLTKEQLHQGKHSYTDYGEDLEVETVGYKKQVEDLLDSIHGRTFSHVEGCEVCKKQQSGSKIKVQPLERVVEHMYTVSRILEILIKGRRVWVSRRAYHYSVEFESHKLT